MSDSTNEVDEESEQRRVDRLALSVTRLFVYIVCDTSPVNMLASCAACEFTDLRLIIDSCVCCRMHLSKN